MQNLDITTQKFNEVIQLSDLELKPLPKQLDRRGYIYLLIDSAYPNYIKIGKTLDPRKRLIKYNSDRPMATCRFILISSAFVDATKVEATILEQLYLKIESTVKTKEWFEIKHIDLLKQWINKAEAEAPIIQD